MFEVYKENCKNCLLSGDSIVSPERRADLLRDIANEQTFFVCHKSSMDGGKVCCRNFFDKLGHTSQMIRIAERLGAVKEVEHTCNDKLMSHREMEGE